jgi:hypothetical protein
MRRCKLGSGVYRQGVLKQKGTEQVGRKTRATHAVNSRRHLKCYSICKQQQTNSLEMQMNHVILALATVHITSFIFSHFSSQSVVMLIQKI